jgi:hypothetical protein
MPDVSLTTFVDFVITSGTPRITAIRKAKRQYEEGYSPAKDFYKQLRDGIITMHEEGHARDFLDDIPTRVSERKQGLYETCIDSYKRWLGRKQISWNSKVSGVWTAGELTVNVNPELGISINGDNYVIKLYYKSDPPPKRSVDTILHLISTTLPRNLRRSRVGLLYVQEGRLIERTSEIPDIDALLIGEAAAFVSMWKQV